MRITRWTLAALFAVLAVSALTAGSASAFHPLFFTQSGKELLFASGVGEGGKFLQLYLNIKAPFGISCEKALMHGWVLNKSTLARRIEVELHGKCKQVIGGSEGTCTEPIQLKELLGELGLVSSTNNKVVLLLAPSTGTQLVTISCSLGNPTLEGAVVAEFPEIYKHMNNEYNKQVSEVELVFESGGSENQNITEIFLLETQMTKVELKIAGAGGGKASWEVHDNLRPDGWIELSTH